MTSCAYFFYFLFIHSRIKHGSQVCEVEDGQKAETQVEHHHPDLLQMEMEKGVKSSGSTSFMV